MTPKEAKDLVKKFPAMLHIYPRGAFDEQLEAFLIRHCEVKK